MAEPVSRNVVAKVVVGSGTPDTVTVGALAIGPGQVPLSAGTLLTVKNLGEMAWVASWVWFMEVR